MKETPLTDDAKFTACVDDSDATYDDVVFADFARRLERERTALIEAMREVVDANTANNPGENSCTCRQCASIRAARALLARLGKEP